MSFDAWRSAVGGQWQRLVLYPSGITAVVLVLLGWQIWRLILRPQKITADRWLNVVGCAPPLVVLALLPLSHAVELRSPLDLPTAWVLLDAPLWMAIAHEWHGNTDQQVRAARRLNGLIVGLPLLLLVLLGQSSLINTVTVANLPKLASSKPWGIGVLGIWLFALIPLLQCGSWRTTNSAMIALGLRRLGHCALLVIAASGWLPKAPSEPHNRWEMWLRDGRLPLLGILLLVWMVVLLADYALRRVTMRRAGQWLWLVAGAMMLVFALFKPTL